MTVLAARNLAKAYKGREVVKDVSLEIPQRRVSACWDPNGAGKNTCFTWWSD